jgi:hypothetical protein
MQSRRVHSEVDQLDMFRQPVLREVAPGKFVPSDPHIKELPEIILCRVVPLGNGEYTLQPFREDWLRMSKENLKLIGMAHQSDTLGRLAKAGFIEILPVAPGTKLLNLTSWYNHLRRVAACQADEENFWEVGKGNIELYREVGGWM